jgi:hypothetical protein
MFGIYREAELKTFRAIRYRPLSNAYLILLSVGVRVVFLSGLTSFLVPR